MPDPAGQPGTLYCWRIPAILVILAITVGLAFSLPQLSIDNSIEVWIDQNSQEFSRYQAFLAHYGSEEYVIIALKQDNALSPESLNRQRQITESLQQLDSINAVISIPSILGTSPTDEHSAPLMPALNNLLINQDKTVAGILVLLNKMNSPDARKAVVNDIYTNVEASLPIDIHTHLAGTPLLNVELDRYSQKAAQSFLPIAIFLSVIILWFCLRHLGMVIVCLISVGINVLWTMAIMAIAGRTLNMVTVVLPSLLFVLSLSHTIHIATRYRIYLADSPGVIHAWSITSRHLWRPVVISCLTTAVGFLSLCLADMLPVVDFGIFAAVGMVLAIPIHFVIVLGLLPYLKISTVTTNSTPWLESMLAWVSQTSIDFSKQIIVAVVIILLACGWCVIKINVDSNIITFFPDDSAVVKDYHFIANNLTGLYSVEVEIQSKESDQQAILSGLTGFTDQVQNQPEVARVIHLGQFQSVANLKTLMKDLSFEQLGKQLQLMQSLTSKYQWQQGQVMGMRASILVREMDSGKYYDLLNRIDQAAKSSFSNALTYQITGIVPLLNDAQSKLVSTQIKCFLIAALVVILMIGILTGSIQAALVSILPNIYPVGIVFACMALLEIPLDAATVMIASVAIGLAVDNTVHCLMHYRDERLLNHPINESIINTYTKTGRAVTFTSLVIACGFSILLLAPFRPIAYFGGLMTITVIAALDADLCVLPACIRFIKLWEKK